MSTPSPEHQVLSGISGVPADATAGASEGRLYHSPVGLLDFQAEGVARAYWQYIQSSHPATFVIWDTGIGKTHLTMASAAMMLEDGLLDHLVVVAETNKVTDWAKDDLPRFTSMSVALYAGAVDKRKKILADPPQVLVMTYETGRNDICQFKGKGSKAVVGEKMLTTALKGKRVLVVFDETSAKLRNRNSLLYTAWDYLLKTLRRQKVGALYCSAMTATSVESSPDNHFNLGRLIAPDLAPTVKQYTETYIAAYDQFGNPSKYHCLTPADCPPGVVPLNQMFAPITLRKRKTDADVIAQFPAKVENPPQMVRLDDRHGDFYEAVTEMLGASADSTELSSFTMLRQIAGHPASLIRSRSTVGQEILRVVGPEALAAMGSTKMDRMIEWQRSMAGQQTVIFTFFGQSILPLLHDALVREGFAVSINHGQMSAAQRYESQQAFKAGQTQIFLSSDAGARGLNLGVGSALLHYELPTLYSTFVQRSNRIHRIDSKSVYGHGSITIDTLVAANTVEEGLADLMLRRNAWSDQIIDDEAYEEDFDPGSQFLTAADRTAMMKIARRAAA